MHFVYLSNMVHNFFFRWAIMVFKVKKRASKTQRGLPLLPISIPVATTILSSITS